MKILYKFSKEKVNVLLFYTNINARIPILILLNNNSVKINKNVIYSPQLPRNMGFTSYTLKIMFKFFIHERS